MKIKKIEVSKWTPLWEAVKLPLRIFVLSVIPLLIAYLTEVSYSWAGIVSLFLVMLDKFLHEIWIIEGKQEDKSKGIVPF